MAANGAYVAQNGQMETDIRYDIIGKNSEAIVAGDVLTVASGLLKVVAAATDPILGVAAKTATMASNNQTVAPIIYPGYIPAEDTVFFMYTNADLTGNATNDGTYYGLTGASGAVVVDVTTGVTTTTSRQVQIVKVDPYNVGGTGSGSGLRQCYVKFFRTPNRNV